MNEAILVLDPAAAARRTLSALLKRQGYQVLQASTLEEGLDLLSRFPVLAVLLELDLSEGDGLKAIQEIRARRNVAILAISCRQAEQDTVRALDLGANDHIVKPFHPGILLARLRVALRTTHGIRRLTGLAVGDLQVYPAERRVYLRGNQVTLTPTEFSLLHVMTRRAGAVVTHRQLLDNVWGGARVNGAGYPRVFMYQLRKKLEGDPDAPKLLLTAPGIGYRLKVPA